MTLMTPVRSWWLQMLLGWALTCKYQLYFIQEGCHVMSQNYINYTFLQIALSFITITIYLDLY